LRAGGSLVYDFGARSGKRLDWFGASNRIPNHDLVYQGLPAMHKSFFDAEAAR